MTKLNKKFLALLLAVMMVMSLTACGDKAPTEEVAESPVVESAAPEAADAEAPADAEAEAPADADAEAPADTKEETPADAEAVKNLTITVVHGDGTKKEIAVSTEAENLRAALEPEGIIAGDESEFGLFVKTVDGETADDSKQQWWCVTKDGVMTETGVDGVMIADGESYEFTLTTGW